MLDCSRMTHRVHTILSILAEDHAPAALRPSILLAIDWPTVAEEAPATGDDAGAATLVALRLRGAITDNHSAIAPLAARLATVAASLTATGDKAMATHATALWGAAAALVGLPSAATLAANPAGWDGLINGIASLTHVLPFCSRADEMLSVVTRWHATAARMDALAAKAADIVPGVVAPGPAEKATLIATALDRIHEYREAIDTAARIATDRDNLRASLTVMEAEVARLTARSPVGRITGVKITINGTEETVFAAGDEIAIKPRPQPGDAVPWAEVEDGCLYYNKNTACPFVTVVDRHHQVMNDASDPDIARFLKAPRDFDSAGKRPTHAYGDGATLVARDLGTDPEAWRKAMREWTANGNKPTSKAAPKAAEDVLPLRDEFTRSIDLTGAWMCLMTGPLGNNGARWSLETTIGNTNNLRMRWPSGCTTTLKDPR